MTHELTKTNIAISSNFNLYPPTLSYSGEVGILLYAETSNSHRIAASSMLEISLQAEHERILDQAKRKGVKAVRRLNKQLASGGLMDEHLADQIVIFMALATSGIDSLGIMGGDFVGAETVERSRCEVLVGEVSFHSQTAMKVAEIILENIVFSTKKIEGGGVIMACERKL